MAVANPFAARGAWLRCALHTHTTNSDGEMPPDKLVRHYDWAGFDVLAITDHSVRTHAASTERLLVLPGVELKARLDGRERDAHVLAVGVDTDPAPRDRELPTLSETVEWVLAHSGAPFLAHTYWSGLRPEEFEGCEGLVGLEVYNAGCELEVGRGLASVHWDEVLERGRSLCGIAVDDSHHPGYDSALAWVWARCEERSAEAVVAALREGRFYSSTGPVIHELDLDDDAVELRCSPAASVTLLSGGRHGARVNAGRLGYRHRGQILVENEAGEIVAARLERPSRGAYGRIEVVDPRGRTAWTNPLW